MSTQKSVQSYLDRHEIGKLFEDMMAKLIIEMPNEPISYLIKLLQKVCLKKSGANTYPSSILCKPGMSLTGSSIPLKVSKDPQIVLPGSKSSASPWVDESAQKNATFAETSTARSQGYEKPWLTGSKQSKGSPKHEKKGSERTEPQSWNTSTKSSAKTVHDIFDENAGERTQGVERIDTPPSIPKENQRLKKNKDRLLTQNLSSDNKENMPAKSVVNNNTSLSTSNKDSSNDELKADTRTVVDNRVKVCSPQIYSKFKRNSSKKKSSETKQKLQALLSNNEGKRTKDDDALADSDYEGEHALEDVNELQLEGARSKSSAGVKRTHRMPASENIKVSVCSRCAHVIDSNLKRSSNNGILANEDFVSVSQLDQEKPYSPDWPNSENDDLVANLLNSPKIPRNGLSIAGSSVEDSKSDFFEKNNPLRNKTKGFSGDLILDDTSDVVEGNENTLLFKSKAWERELVETGSDTDIDNGGLQKGSGWKQTVARSEVISDI